MDNEIILMIFALVITAFYAGTYATKEYYSTKLLRFKVRKKPVTVYAEIAQRDLYIDTLEGKMKATKGDYIITGVNGEQYPVKPDIFKKTYDIID